MVVKFIIINFMSIVVVASMSVVDVYALEWFSKFFWVFCLFVFCCCCCCCFLLLNYYYSNDCGCSDLLGLRFGSWIP